LSRAPAAKVTSFLYVQPLLASLVAWAWLGQTLTPLAIAGGVLAIGGVVLAVRGPRAVAVARPLAGVVPAPASALPACCRS
jgi:drug/metabolite transporter (DMT)-like permease